MLRAPQHIQPKKKKREQEKVRGQGKMKPTSTVASGNPSCWPGIPCAPPEQRAKIIAACELLKLDKAASLKHNPTDKERIDNTLAALSRSNVTPCEAKRLDTVIKKRAAQFEQKSGPLQELQGELVHRHTHNVFPSPADVPEVLTSVQGAFEVCTTLHQGPQR